MPVILRLSRMGRNKICRYRIVAADSRRSRDGKFLELLGTYNPQAQPREFSYKTDRVAYWIKKGAQLSDTVRNLLDQDRFGQRKAAIEKGLAPEGLSIVRKPEGKPRRKKRAVKEAAKN